VLHGSKRRWGAGRAGNDATDYQWPIVRAMDREFWWKKISIDMPLNIGI